MPLTLIIRRWGPDISGPGEKTRTRTSAYPTDAAEQERFAEFWQKVSRRRARSSRELPCAMVHCNRLPNKNLRRYTPNSDLPRPNFTVGSPSNVTTHWWQRLCGFSSGSETVKNREIWVARLAPKTAFSARFSATQPEGNAQAGQNVSQMVGKAAVIAGFRPAAGEPVPPMPPRHGSRGK